MNASAARAELGDFDELDVRRPQRRDRSARHAGKEKDVVRQLAVGLEEFRRPDRAGFGLDDDDDAVGAVELVAIVLERLYIFMFQRHDLVEAGRQAQLRGIVARDNGQNGEKEQDRRPRSERQILDKLYRGLPHPVSPPFCPVPTGSPGEW